MTVCDKVCDRGINDIVLCHKTPVPIRICVNTDNHIKLTVSDENVNVISCVWFRAKMLKTNHYAKEEDRYRFFSEYQWYATYQGLQLLCDNICLDTLSSLVIASRKLHQLQIAKKSNFHVPSYEIVTSKLFLRHMLKVHGSVIIKPIGEANIPKIQASKVSQGKVIYDAVMTHKLSYNDLDDFDDEQFMQCPIFAQKYIEKKHEYRVVVVGDDVFPFSIDSQSTNYTKIDWRLGNRTLAFTPCKLDDQIVKSIMTYMGLMKLNCGSFDLVHGVDDCIWFLECNPEGQWLWLDRLVGGRISTAYADLVEAKINNPPSPTIAGEIQ